MGARELGTLTSPALPDGWSIDAAEDVLRLRCMRPLAAPMLDGQGWRLRHIEDDLILRGVPAVEAPATGIELRPWTEGSTEEAYGVYVESFRDRPGFPGWDLERWASWATGYEAFRPDLSSLAYVDGVACGYVVVAREPAEAWVVQMGVMPSHRRRGIGLQLLARSWDASVADAAPSVGLSVNENNPGARALYEGFGFRFACRRAVYVPTSTPGSSSAS